MKIAYGLREAGEAIGVSRTTIWRMIAAGQLKAFKLGGRTLVHADELEALIERARKAA